eukprot:gene8041-9555_t
MPFSSRKAFVGYQATLGTRRTLKQPIISDDVLRRAFSEGVLGGGAGRVGVQSPAEQARLKVVAGLGSGLQSGGDPQAVVPMASIDATPLYQRPQGHLTEQAVASAEREWLQARAVALESAAFVATQRSPDVPMRAEPSRVEAGAERLGNSFGEAANVTAVPAGTSPGLATPDSPGAAAAASIAQRANAAIGRIYSAAAATAQPSAVAVPATPPAGRHASDAHSGLLAGAAPASTSPLPARDPSHGALPRAWERPRPGALEDMRAPILNPGPAHPLGVSPATPAPHMLEDLATPANQELPETTPAIDHEMGMMRQLHTQLMGTAHAPGQPQVAPPMAGAWAGDAEVAGGSPGRRDGFEGPTISADVGGLQGVYAASVESSRRLMEQDAHIMDLTKQNYQYKSLLHKLECQLAGATEELDVLKPRLFEMDDQVEWLETQKHEMGGRIDGGEKDGHERLAQELLEAAQRESTTKGEQNEELQQRLRVLAERSSDAEWQHDKLMQSTMSLKSEASSLECDKAQLQGRLNELQSENELMLGNEKLLQGCFHGWRKRTQQDRAQRARKHILDQHVQHLELYSRTLEQRAMLVWRVFCTQRRWVASLNAQALARWERRTVGAVLWAWSEELHAVRMESGVCRRMQRGWDTRRTSFALHAWRLRAVARRLELARSRRGKVRLGELCARHAFRRWTQVVAECQHNKVIMQRAAQRWLKQLLGAALHQWRLQRLDALQARECVLRMSRRMAHLNMLRPWNSWRLIVSGKQRNCQIIQRVVSRWQANLTSAMFRQWAQLHWTLRMVRNVLSRMQNQVLLGVVCRWQEQVQELKVSKIHMQRVLARLLKRAMGQSFETWKDIWSTFRRQKFLMRRTIARMSIVRLWNSFAYWRDIRSYQKHQRTVLKRILQRMKNTFLGATFSNWQGQLFRVKAASTQLKRALVYFTKSSMAQAFSCWSEKTVNNSMSKKTLMRIVRRMQQIPLSNAFAAWRKLLNHKQAANQVIERVVLRWSNSLMSEAFTWWWER